MPNIYDVAKRARVSVATVSAVLNDSAFVSADLKSRVHAAVDALGYQPNLLARSMAKQRTQTLGMIVPDIANPFFPEVVRGAEDTAHAGGYTLLIASSDNDLKKEAIYLRLFLAKRVDGIILTKAPGRLPPELQSALAKAGVPIVLLARTVPGFSTDAVELDDKGAAFEGVTHLLRLGYRRIGFIGGLHGASTSRRRLDGYKAALKAWKIRLDPALVDRRRLPRRIGLPRRARSPEGTPRRGVHRELPDDGRVHGGAAPVPAALPRGRRARHLRRLPVDGLVLAAPDHDRSAQARARRRRGEAPGRTDRQAGRPPANGEAEERDAGAGVVRLRAARQHGAGPMTYDVLAIGRSSIDLYAHEIGRAIADVRSFDAYVGGCPTNVSVGTRRLGLRSALLTAVGDDQVGDFVTAFLEREQVETRFIPRKPGRRTSAVILTIQPPDRFPLTFYRDNCADRALTIDDVERGAGGREPGRVRHRHRAQPRAGPGGHAGRRGGRSRRRRAGRRRHRLPPRSVGRCGEHFRRRCARCCDRRRSPSAPRKSWPRRPASDDVAQGADALLASGIEALIIKRGARGATVFRRGSSAG